MVFEYLFDQPLEVNREAVLLGLSTINATTLLLQAFWRSDFNPFAPIHPLLYRISGVTGPSPPSAPASTEEAGTKERWLDKVVASVRVFVLPLLVAAVSAIVQYYILIYYSSAPSTGGGGGGDGGVEGTQSGSS